MNFLANQFRNLFAPFIQAKAGRLNLLAAESAGAESDQVAAASFAPSQN